MQIENPRVLGVVRLSVGRDDSTSPERQREHIERWANGSAIMGTVVGWAEDLDVSGAVSPFKRPGLSVWLNERADEFDVICAWKLDRLTCRVLHFSELADWCRQRGKDIISTSESLDLGTPMGKMFAQIISAFAEGELDAIKARSLDASRKLREKGAWFGGALPLGYRFADRPDGGKRLEQDPVYAPLLRSLYERVMDGTPINQLTKELNAQGLRTWRDHLRVETGRPSRNTLWTSKAIEQALRSPRIAGHLLHKGNIVEGGDGEPVFLTDEPILSVSEWERVVHKLTAARRPGTRTPKEPSLLAGVARCGVDGASVYVKRNTVKRAYKDSPDVYMTYTCRHAYSGSVKQCRTACSKEALEDIVAAALMEFFGEDEILKKTPSSRRELIAECERVSARLAALEEDFAAGRYDADGQRESYHRMHVRIARKQAALRRQIKELPEVEFTGTGRTFKELWNGGGPERRRSFLIENGVRVLVWRQGKGLKNPQVKVEIPDLPDTWQLVGGREVLSVRARVVDWNMPEQLCGLSVDEVLGNAGRGNPSVEGAVADR